jgi:site-specific DNA-methyltransferase (adenine-specific)/modification methylase
MSDDIRVIHGDSLDVLPTLTGIDAVVTDPPYGISERTDRASKGRGKLAPCNDFPPVMGDDRPFDPAPWLQFPRVILWGANHYGSRLPDASRWLVWDKRDGLNPNDNADCELAWTNLGGPARLFHHRWNGMIKDSEQAQKRVHPTQKPVRLMAWCLAQLNLPPGSLVVDPYAGSGSLGVACLKAGLRCILIEKDQRYIKVIKRRLADAATPLFAGVDS